MIEFEDNVRQDITKCVPSSIINELTCFTFYDNHPRDDFNLDIIVCTNCELLEYLNRELVLSTRVKLGSKPRDLKIMRNSHSELHYFVASKSEIIIFSRKNSIQIHKIVSNVDKYEISDPLCHGRANLRIYCHDDAVPLIFNENFEQEDNSISLESAISDGLPIIIQLKRKLIEAQYTVQCNQKAYEDLIKMRQIAVATIAQRISLSSDDCFIKNKPKVSEEVSLQKPWIAMCNRQIVITLKVTNRFNSTIENVHILLHSLLPSLLYATKVFKKVYTAPYINEKQKNTIDANSSVYLAVVINMKELCDSDTNQTNFEGVLTYVSDGKNFVIPIENIQITASDLMGKSFDVLSNVEGHDSDNLVLALLATSEKTDLCLRHIKSDDQMTCQLPSVFTEHLQMELLKHINNVLIHKSSPHHVLYGVLMVIEQGVRSHIHNVTVYSRKQKQVLALIHYMQDVFPFRIIATTPQYQLISKTPQYDHFTEDTNITEKLTNLTIYTQSIIDQSTKILKHFDDCMIKMNESKNALIKNKIGQEIDLYAIGKHKFNELKENILEEVDRSVEKLMIETSVEIDDDNIMIIDD